MSFSINRVYTRSGDSGKTSLADGSRVSKSHLRIAACGDLDELSSVLGVLKVNLSEDSLELGAHLEAIQQDLFDIGGLLAREDGELVASFCEYFDRRVTEFEKLCDSYGEELPELKSFVLSGGNQASAGCHHARALARRAERALVAVEQENPPNGVASEVLRYINRLSDLLFIFARWSAYRGQVDETLWVKPEKRLKKD